MPLWYEAIHGPIQRVDVMPTLKVRLSEPSLALGSSVIIATVGKQDFTIV